MECPACKIDLVMSERQGIEIDYCPKCRGVWLDRGELDKIIERSHARQNDLHGRPPEHHYGHPGKEQYHGAYEYKKRRKKSFLEELFD